jgi:glutamate racemase
MIGLFDSGCGGLTVYDALRRTFPQRSLLYFGDHAKAPYGERAPDEIQQLTKRAVEQLCGFRSFRPPIPIIIRPLLPIVKAAF